MNDDATPLPSTTQPRPSLRDRHVTWRLHPGVRTGDALTFGERAADRMRNGMGSWPFVFVFIAFMVAWAVVNTVALRSNAWDPYPYILLNLFLSMLAGLQGAILLIAAKRADQVSAETAVHTLNNTERLKDLIEQNNRLTEEVEQLARRIRDCVEPLLRGADGDE